MYVLMLGAPGTGKGTIGAALCKEFKLEHLATGDIFREEIKKGTDLGIEADKYISKGKFVPDSITIAMVEEYLDKHDNALLDGFPRTTKQAKALKEYLHQNKKEITAVINLDIPDEDIILRTSKRVVCSNKECGASYNTEFMPSKEEGICDVCGSSLYRRKDDYPEIIQGRLDLYHKETEPLIGYYKKEGLLEVIDIDIYSPTTKEDTTKKAIDIIKGREAVKIEE